MKYNRELAQKICILISDGQTLADIAKLPGMPALHEIYNWLNKNKKFATEYQKASNIKAETLFHEILNIADGDGHDNPDISGSESLNRAKLKIDSRKWLLERMCPEKYSDKAIKHNISQDQNPVQYIKIIREITEK